MNWFKIVGNRVSAMRTGAVSKGHDDLRGSSFCLHLYRENTRKQPILLCWNDEKHVFHRSIAFGTAHFSSQLPRFPLPMNAAAQALAADQSGGDHRLSDGYRIIAPMLPPPALHPTAAAART
jgi:hypothetical protein